MMVMFSVVSALSASGMRGVRTTKVSLDEDSTVPSYATLLFAKVTDTSAGSVEKPWPLMVTGSPPAAELWLWLTEDTVRGTLMVLEAKPEPRR